MPDHALFSELPVPRAVLKLALPSVAGQVILVIYNMADTFFAAMTGSDAVVCAVTVCMPAFMLLSAVANLFGIGGAGVISRALGARDPRRAESAGAFSFYGCLCVTALYALTVGLFLDPVIDLLGGSDPVVHSLCRDYLLCTVVYGGVFASLGTMLSHLLRAQGCALAAGIGICLGGVLNIALDPLFMFVLLPKGFEVLGAAAATAVSNLAAALFFLLLLRKKRLFSLRPRSSMLKEKIPSETMDAGLPACLMTLFENLSFAVLDSRTAALGIAAQAGLGVAKKLNMLAHCIVRGMAQGVLPLIGYTYASGDRRRMKSAVLCAAAVSVLTASACMAAGLLGADRLIGIFVHTQNESAAFGARFLHVLCLGAPFSAWGYACISFFQAVGKRGHSILLALLRKGLVDIPLMLVLPASLCVFATPAADLLCCAVSAVLFCVFLKKTLSETVPG